MIDPLDTVRESSVTFTSPGTSDRSAMPLGNGELCASVWSDGRGLHFYLGRTDAITELDRNVKLGVFSAELTPNVFDTPDSFEQSLDMEHGRVRVHATKGTVECTLTLHIDAEQDDAHLRIEATGPIDARVTASTWRTAPRGSVDAAPALWGDEDPHLLPALTALSESADLTGSDGNGVFLAHHNARSLVPTIAALHGLDPERDGVPDLIIGRSFGSYLTVAGHRPTSDSGFTIAQATEIDIRVATFSSQTESAGDAIRRLSRERVDAAASRARTTAHWRRYWGRSWIVVHGDTRRVAECTAEVRRSAGSHELAAVQPSSLSPVTRAYVLTKWMNACGMTGAFPIQYNGALFTTMPGGGEHLALESFGRSFASAPETEPTLQLNPDERTWSIENLWQNLRLPYYSALARGEVEALLPVFSYYRRFERLNQARARLHYNAEGQWNTEMTMTCGLQTPAIYGLARDGVSPGTPKNRWGGAIDLSPGLELTKLMFDYWRFTGDTSFLIDTVIPYALDLLRFASSRYERGADGRLVFGPMNSVETYFDTLDPLPVVVGYRRMVHDLLSLPPHLLHERAFVEEVAVLLPDVPRVAGDDPHRSLAPARVYADTRMNVESAELYAIYPFDLPEVSDDVRHATWSRCLEISGAFRPTVIGEPVGTASYSGWQYLAPAAARIGRLGEAIEALEHNVALTNPGFAFPAMWGPIYDSVPDVDHGANILNTLHEIVDAVLARPELASTLPEAWSVDFRVFTPTGAPITGRIENGTLERMHD